MRILRVFLRENDREKYPLYKCTRIWSLLKKIENIVVSILSAYFQSICLISNFPFSRLT